MDKLTRMNKAKNSPCEQPEIERDFPLPQEKEFHNKQEKPLVRNLQEEYFQIATPNILSDYQDPQ